MMDEALIEKVRDIAMLSADGIGALVKDPDERAVAHYIAGLILMSVAVGDADGKGSPGEFAASLKVAADAMQGAATWAEATIAVRRAFSRRRKSRRH